MTNMNTAPNSAHRIDVNTRRLRNSCDFCTRSKLKCDQSKPECHRCLRRGRDCVYSRVRKAGRPPKVPNKRHNAVTPMWEHPADHNRMDFLPCTPSPSDASFDSISGSSLSSRIGSIDCMADTSVTDFSDSRTSTPSTGENMEAKLLNYFDGVSSNWNNRPGCLPAPQDLDWLLPYSIDISSPLYDTNFPMEDLLALDMPSPTFTSSCFSMEQSSPSQSMHQYMGISTPDSLPDFRISYPNHSGTEQSKISPVSTPDVSQGSETMSVPEHTSHSTRTKDCNCFSLICQLQESVYHHTQLSSEMDSQVPLGILLDIENSIHQTEQTIRHCQYCEPRSSHFMMMLCPVIDWVVDSLGKVLLRGVAPGSASPSFEQPTKGAPQVGDSGLSGGNGGIPNLCIYELLKGRLRRLGRILNDIGGETPKDPADEPAYLDSDCLVKAMGTMGQDIRTKLDYHLRLVELWLS
ncbi:hypothetical protein CFIO01_01920 [Colletotrichum fioriniae PJ7]|uniref:Zn(2)-C6 fungal-type domain-containing protein n=1 Tax=Colletotrichum fioriniae PJ7 TaxID=1445577 RepID=A0A010Q3S6_9PEZI|nr:hypothetical protein CFIO01_01920 [Colletotrichum fioriniae PJ7]